MDTIPDLSFLLDKIRVFKILKKTAEYSNLSGLLIGELKNFIKKKSSEIDSLGVRYDYGSIMHYGKRTFSKNSYDNTILPKKKEKNDPTIHIGQRETLSDLDVLQANLLYKCPRE